MLGEEVWGAVGVSVYPKGVQWDCGQGFVQDTWVHPVQPWQPMDLALCTAAEQL